MKKLFAHAKERLNYFKECWEHIKQHRIGAAAIFLVALYSFYTDWFLRTVQVPKRLVFEVPKLPLGWAAVIVLTVLFLTVFEGGFRRLQVEVKAKRILENQKEDLQEKLNDTMGQWGAMRDALENASEEVDRLKQLQEVAPEIMLEIRHPSGDPLILRNLRGGVARVISIEVESQGMPVPHYEPVPFLAEQQEAPAKMRFVMDSEKREVHSSVADNLLLYFRLLKSMGEGNTPYNPFVERRFKVSYWNSHGVRFGQKFRVDYSVHPEEISIYPVGLRYTIRNA